MNFDLKTYLDKRKTWVDKALAEIFDPSAEPRELYEAMTYSLTAGGKRIRPILMMATYEIFQEDGRDILPFACAMEMVHTYSLIHDDLPAMDDDDLRRGKPTCHKVYGDAMAILAGDGLLTEAFNLIANGAETSEWPADIRLSALGELASAAGTKGMVGGQAMDILSEHKSVGVETVRFIHSHKTAALIRASVRMGAILGKAGANDLETLSRYGQSIGVAFQIVDDILDIEGNTELLGKEAGSDDKLEKATYPHVVGMAESRREATQLIQTAKESIAVYGERALPLKGIADLILARNT
ncbi:MAG: polyprenyl synthetase family protein [Deltaproteobacteria bacterium]|nr:MAG: polyprenyl synthetase family protein [Deltaproteobacteria bacterium]